MPKRLLQQVIPIADPAHQAAHVDIVKELVRIKRSLAFDVIHDELIVWRRPVGLDGT